MSEKTCGTCAHGLRNIVYCETTNPNANTAGLHGAGEAACKRYSERPDSVEQVAIDAVKLIFDPPNYSRYKLMREAAEGYAERLHTLGVDV